jgi:hypothetical protein
MSNEIEQEKTRVKSLANSDVKKMLIKNKWRRLCAVDKCKKQSQRKGLCARHLTENKNQQKSTASITTSDQSFGHSTTKQFGTISSNSTNLIPFMEIDTEQNTFLGDGKLFVA